MNSTMKKRFLFLIVSCSSLILSAQTFTGKVLDEKNQPIEFANIALYSLPDSTLIAGTVTNTQGEFSLAAHNAKNGFLKISIIGYETVTKHISQVSAPVNITLQAVAVKLRDVVVQANRITRSEKGYSILLSGSDLAKGKKVGETLGLLPGVSYENGAFKINGLPVSEIYVNNVKIANLKELESIAGEHLSKAEIEYFAGSENRANMIGGIIRLQLKRPEGGYYGNVTLSGGVKPHYGLDNAGTSAMISYGYKKWNIYNNLNLGRYQTYEDMNMSKINTNTTETVLKSKEFNVGKQNQIFNHLSVTYDINDNNTLGVSLYANVKRNDSHSKSDFEIPQNIESNHIYNKNNTFQSQATVNYKSVLNKKGTNLSVSGDYLFFQNKADNQYIIGATNDISKTRNNVDLWKADANIKTPIGQAMQLTGGAAVNMINTRFRPIALANSNSNWFTPIPEADMRSVSPFVYLSLAGQKGFFRYNIGLNLQQNTIYYKDANAAEETKNTQSSLSPNLQLMYVLNPQKGHIAMLMFKRSLDDIPYDAINPNSIWADRYNYTTGNPDLKAQKTNVGMALLSLFNEKLNVSGTYAYAANTIYYQTLQDPDNPNILYTKPINLSGASLLALIVETNQTLTKWWKVKAGGRYEYHKENAVLGVQKFQSGNNRFYFEFNNNFTFKNNFGGTLSATAEPTYKHYGRTYHGVYVVSGSLYKALLKNRLNASANFFLLGNMRKLERQSDNFTVISDNQTHVQRISLSLTWLFNGGKKVNVKTTESIQSYKEIKDNK